jgi:hypothetical protein
METSCARVVGHVSGTSHYQSLSAPENRIADHRGISREDGHRSAIDTACIVAGHHPPRGVNPPGPASSKYLIVPHNPAGANPNPPVDLFIRTERRSNAYPELDPENETGG